MKAVDPLSHLLSNFQLTLHSIGTSAAPDALEVKADHLSWLTGLPHPFGNLVLALDMNREGLAEVMQRVETFSRDSKAPVALVLFPQAAPAGATALAQDRGWILLDEMPGMWLDIRAAASLPSLPEGVSLDLAEEDTALRSAILVLSEGYPVPPTLADLWMSGFQRAGNASGGCFANFLASVDGEAASCSSVSVLDGVAGIYCVATREEFRGRGLGEAVTRAAVDYARRKGATHALLHATEMGFSVYQRIGFQTRTKIPVLGFGLG